MTDLVVDSADRRASVVLNVFSAAGLSGIAAVLSDPRMLGPQDWRYPAAVGVALGGLAAVMPLRRGARAAAAVMACCWAAPCGWIAYGWLAHRLWSLPYWITWAAGAVALGIATHTWTMPMDFGASMHQQAPAAAGVAGPVVPDEWATLIARVTKGKIVGVTGAERHDWDTGTGYTVFGQMPPDGSTWETLQPFEPGLAAALLLGKGGGVTVGPDLEGNAASFRLDVLEQDAMAGSMTYPGLDDGDY